MFLTMVRNGPVQCAAHDSSGLRLALDLVGPFSAQRKNANEQLRSGLRVLVWFHDLSFINR